MTRNTKRPAVKSRSRNTKQQRPSKGKKSSINVNQLTQKATERPEAKVYESGRSFAEMPLDGRLLRAIAKKGFEKPTEIQDKTIEPLLKGRDLMGVAQTGTGKTGAFLIPLINRLLSGKEKFQVLVLAPTRELAVQIDEEFKSLTAGLRLYSQCFIGGTNINRDLQTLRRSSHVVIGTPGRLLDLSQRKALRFSDFDILILDEFDRMLDMGFNKDVQRITVSMQKRKQTLLFSATVDHKQKGLIDQLLRNPIEVKVSNGETTGKHIDQEIIKVAEGQDKFGMLKELLAQPGFDKVLVFAETKRWVSRVNKKLTQSGFSSDEIHGNKSQNYRQNALKKFSKGGIQILVATDVAARGLDVSDVTHVINYQLPASIDSYIHRIGRTGRAGKNGKAYTFIN
ncbi:DEAD/DEAH box helicase [Phaeocystidibacter luteus]|uniref:DEAD/DEAH box helicase n=1 Tax=Phaeocystidibacter luteus TaxID=911197 RepID=A0A6N6RFW5_9FLAO|nr:DEAD/DEAH box helicase [Phaeocystidibacter luteus]KAB2810061.1 DEAD/DEAH box helicase [Phaeocystidibacter luteus]